MSDEPDGEVDDEERLAAALAVLAVTGGGDAPIGGLARWRARRLAALGRTGERGSRRDRPPTPPRDHAIRVDL